MEAYNIDRLLQKATGAWRSLRNDQHALKKIHFIHYSEQVHIYDPETWYCIVCGEELEEGHCLWAKVEDEKFLCVVHGSLDDEMRLKCLKNI